MMTQSQTKARQKPDKSQTKPDKAHCVCSHLPMLVARGIHSFVTVDDGFMRSERIQDVPICPVLKLSGFMAHWLMDS